MLIKRYQTNYQILILTLVDFLPNNKWLNTTPTPMEVMTITTLIQRNTPTWSAFFGRDPKTA